MSGIRSTSHFGGVAVDLAAEQVGERLTSMAAQVQARAGARPQRFLVQEMVSGGTELILGMHRDPLGTAILLGMGGVTAELFRDTVMRLLPRHGGVAQRAVRPPRVALIGLRGAGKSTLGSMLAQDLDFPFLELSREIEKFAGCSIAEIQALYGQNAYRRYERRAVEEAIQIYPEAVIAVPGGLVSEPATFNLLLSHCTTVWLRAHPEDHMRRVAAQGDFRPMAGNREAMGDLKGILAQRTSFYSKADIHLDTSAKPQDETFLALRSAVRSVLRIEETAI